MNSEDKLMRRTLLTILAGAFAINALGQGVIEWGNNFSDFRAPIYDRDQGNVLLSIVGQSSLGIPSGNTFYSGPLLTGNAWTFAVFIGPASAVDSSSLTLLAATTFRTSTSTAPQALPKGLVDGGTAPVPSVSAGDACKFQIRVWDNWGGTVTSWEQAISRDVLHNTSPLVTSLPLGGIGSSGGIFLNPRTVGWTSFNIFGDQAFSGGVPEPSTWGLASLSGAGLLVWRFRHSR